MKLFAILTHSIKFKSLLTQERGLKHRYHQKYQQALVSLLTQERGLKQKPLRGRQSIGLVAPHTGAWIETVQEGLKLSGDMSLLTQERGLKR